MEWRLPGGRILSPPVDPKEFELVWSDTPEERHDDDYVSLVEKFHILTGGLILSMWKGLGTTGYEDYEDACFWYGLCPEGRIVVIEALEGDRIYMKKGQR